MLNGLDAVAWEDLEGAYGPAGEVPGLLRRVAEGGEDGWEALGALRGTILHQGSVCSATGPAVPFLGALLDGREPTSGVLWLLGDMADIVDPSVASLAEVRAAVSGLADRILPLLDHPEALVRGLAAYALAKCPGRADESVPALRARLRGEDDPTAVGNLLIAEAVLSRGDDLIREALGDERPAIRGAAALAAALACQERTVLASGPGPAWPGDPAAAAVKDCFAGGDPWLDRGDVDDVPMNLGYPWGWDPVDDLVENIPQEAVPDIVAALLASSSAPVRRAALAAAHGAFHADGPDRLPSPHRERLARNVASALTDPRPALRLAAVHALIPAGASAAGAADALAALAPQEPAAITVLAALADPRWHAPAVAHLTAGTAHPTLAADLAAHAIPLDPLLLASVHTRLATLPDDAPFDPDAHLTALREGRRPAFPHSHATERRALNGLLASWGLPSPESPAR
ncbi:hypothetical protein EDD29_4589 [Actinocorallia herbida]|uniref:HEAT repeat protein n=1 Tax=Actinocorallia herbida TaxID=58109 RepID=A0A3N1D0E5_9ACTN|nr:hypothetical protein [Actinocorallia herbida]ROO87001.1 hypothetical protein EDD29_4589 [Actinocorallia herbida]